MKLNKGNLLKWTKGHKEFSRPITHGQLKTPRGRDLHSQKEEAYFTTPAGRRKSFFLPGNKLSQ